jgi:hypothetical protein
MYRRKNKKQKQLLINKQRRKKYYDKNIYDRDKKDIIQMLIDEVDEHLEIQRLEEEEEHIEEEEREYEEYLSNQQSIPITLYTQCTNCYRICCKSNISKCSEIRDYYNDRILVLHRDHENMEIIMIDYIRKIMKNKSNLDNYLKLHIQENNLISYYYNIYFNIEEGCNECKCKKCNTPLTISMYDYEDNFIHDNISTIYESSSVNDNNLLLIQLNSDRKFIKYCSMCKKLKKYIKNSFEQIKILRLLNKECNNKLKNIEYNEMYYNILDMTTNILAGIKNNIFNDLIRIIKKKDITSIHEI